MFTLFLFFSYGKPGVEFHYEFETDVEVLKLLFVSTKGQLICLCSDFSLHLLQITHQLEQSSVAKLHSNNHFVSEDEAASSANKDLTTIAINRTGNVVFIGTKAGDIHLLDVSSFKLKSSSISQEKLLKLVSGDLKKPGSVEAIEESPLDSGKILIGYNRSLIAFWDYENEVLVKHFLIEQVRITYSFLLFR